MGKIKDFQINLERKKAVFCSGDVIKGSLNFKLIEHIKLNSLKLFIIGESEYFFNSNKQNGQTYGKKRVFEQNIKSFICILPKEKQGETFSLNEGYHSYQFQIQLCDGLPNSLKHEQAETKYYLKAVLDLSWSLNENFLKEIILINQNYYDQKNIYPNDKITCAQTKMYGIWCLEFPIFAYLTLNKRYFLAKEEIEFSVRINNPSSKPILKLTVNLIKQIKCFNGKKETDFEEILDQKVNYTFIEPRADVEWLNENLKLPLTEPSDSFSKIININYYVELEVHTGCYRPRLRVNIPIVLGLFPTGYTINDIEKFIFEK